MYQANQNNSNDVFSLVFCIEFNSKGIVVVHTEFVVLNSAHLSGTRSSGFIDRIKFKCIDYEKSTFLLLNIDAAISFTISNYSL